MANKQPTSHLALLGDPHSGRDEMNLAGHPFALLQRPQRCSKTSIFYEWKRVINGREVTASWRVETPDAFGLPGPEEELLYLVLLQLTREAAEKAGTPAQWLLRVPFSRGDVMNRMGWDDCAHRYAALKLAFSRLKSVSIFAEYAFYDARTKTPVNSVGFGIINEFSLADEPKGRRNREHQALSHFEWNTVLHTSFLAGNLRSMNLDFVIALQNPTSRRLFRLLELLRYAAKPPRPQVSIEVSKLASRLGMTSYPHPSQIAQKLAPAIAELQAHGYLKSITIEKNADGSSIVHFRFADAFAAPSPQLAPPTPAMEKQAEREVMLPPMDFAALLPAWNAPAPREADDNAANLALDAFFEALPLEEQRGIEAAVRAQMPDFLLDNLAGYGAKTRFERERRRETLERYPHALLG